MSDTPRTDAVASDGWSGDAICVCADFARGLERENAMLMSELQAVTLKKEKLAAKLRETRRHLRAANKGAERNALVAQLCAARAALRSRSGP